MPTTTATIGQQTFTVSTSSDLSGALAQSLLNTAATLGINAVFTRSTAPLATAELGSFSPALVTVAPSTTTLLDIDAAPHVAIGGGGSQQVLLNGENATYFTGASLSSVVLAADDTNSSIVNSTAGGALVAVTNAGGNVLVGAGTANAFASAASSRDVVVFSGVANSMDSAGQDQVTILGGTRSDAVTVEATGRDFVNLANGAGMSFTNNDAAQVSTVAGSAGSRVTIGGAGATAAYAGAGVEALNAATSTGNVTLAGGIGSAVLIGGAGSDTFLFTRGDAGGQETIANFTAADTLQLAGYGAAGAIRSETTSGGNVTLTLGDNTRITFQGLGLLNAAQISIT